MTSSNSAKWIAPNLSIFVALLLEAIVSGKGDGTGFKSQVWGAINVEFNDQTGLNYERSQLISKYSELKGKYKIFSALKNNSGFGWDPEKLIPTAPDDVWDRYIAAHKGLVILNH